MAIRLSLETSPKLLKSNLYGGIIFGLGWALVGACPGPILFFWVQGLHVLVLLFFATLGTFVYGKLKKRLPH